MMIVDQKIVKIGWIRRRKHGRTRRPWKEDIHVEMGKRWLCFQFVHFETREASGAQAARHVSNCKRLAFRSILLFLPWHKIFCYLKNFLLRKIQTFKKISKLKSKRQRKPYKFKTLETVSRLIDENVTQRFFIKTNFLGTQESHQLNELASWLQVH